MRPGRSRREQTDGSPASLVPVRPVGTACRGVPAQPAPPQYPDLLATTGELLLGLVILLSFGWFGALIVARRPSQPIGWILCALAGTITLINRTLVYGLLTVLLGAIYAIQQTVDRRFNRRKYNAVKTVEVFSARLCYEVHPDTLSTELLALVDETVQPTRSSLWLRPTGQGSQHTAR